MRAVESKREALLGFIADIQAGRTSVTDKFIVVDDETWAIPSLLNSLSNCSDQLPNNEAWVVADYPEIVGRQAGHTYRNAVRVIRRWRRQETKSDLLLA